MSSKTEPKPRDRRAAAGAVRPSQRLWDPGPDDESDTQLATPPRSRRRRGLGIVVIVALCVAIAAVLLWFVWLPGWRPELHPGEHYGIDVSAEDGAIAWRPVRDDDVDFAYLKATEGREFTDARFDRNWLDTAAVGIEHGAYHTFTLCSPGADQARHFLNVAPPDPAALPPAVDLEQLAGPCGASTDSVGRELRQFLSMVDSAWGRQVVVYATSDFEARYPVTIDAGRPRWKPHLLTRPDGNGWGVWQASQRAHVEGIPATVDLDVAATGWLAPADDAQPESRASRR